MQKLKEILGDIMYIPSADDRPPVCFQSPDALKNRIIISDKPPGDSVADQVQWILSFAKNNSALGLWNNRRSSACVLGFEF